MSLKLAAYDPGGDMKARHARAVAMFTNEYNAVKDPGVRSTENSLKINNTLFARRKRGISTR